MRKKLVASVTIAATTLAFGSPALAGEVSGNNELTPINDHRAASICAFSGLEDFDDLTNGDVQPGMTQTFGGELQAFAEFYPGGIPGLAKDGIIKTGPGTECRGNN